MGKISRIEYQAKTRQRIVKILQLVENLRDDDPSSLTMEQLQETIDLLYDAKDLINHREQMLGPDEWLISEKKRTQNYMEDFIQIALADGFMINANDNVDLFSASGKLVKGNKAIISELSEEMFDMDDFPDFDKIVTHNTDAVDPWFLKEKE